MNPWMISGDSFFVYTPHVLTLQLCFANIDISITFLSHLIT